MSQISDVCSLEEAESDYEDSESSRHTASSLSRCNSSCSIAHSAAEREKNREASTSLETAWTDSKHSSYLDLMEANFVKNLYGRSYCVQDVCGQRSDLDLHHENECTEVEECDDDSAQSRLHMPSETMEFKMYNHGDWTWRPVSSSMVPAGIPWVLLKNPWVKHFRTKNSPTISSTVSSTLPSSLAKVAVGSATKTSATSNSNTIPSTLLSSREDEAGRVNVARHAQLPLVIMSHDLAHQGVNTSREIASRSNPDSEESKGKLAACGRGNDHLEAGLLKQRIQQSLLDQTVDAGISNTKKRALLCTHKQVLVTRQKTGNEVEDCHGYGTFDQDDAVPSNEILDLPSERLGKLVEES